MNKKQTKFTQLAIDDFKYNEEVKKWSHKELGDYIIQEIWGYKDFNKFGTLKCAVLDRVIEELFKLEDIEVNKYIKAAKILKENDIIKTHTRSNLYGI